MFYFDLIFFPIFKGVLAKIEPNLFGFDALKKK